MDDALKTTGTKYFNVETWLLFAPPIKISGYAPASVQLSFVVFAFYTPFGVSLVVCDAHLGLLVPCATRLFL